MSSRFVGRLLVVALLLVGTRLAAAPAAPASDPLVIEQAQHVVNPIYGGEVPRAELHGVFKARNKGRSTIFEVKLMVHMQEKASEYPLGDISSGDVATTEWSMVATGDQRPPVTLDVYGRVEGRRIHLRVDSREVAPPAPEGSPGGPPPGY